VLSGRLEIARGRAAARIDRIERPDRGRRRLGADDVYAVGAGPTACSNAARKIRARRARPVPGTAKRAANMAEPAEL
jgi:hypothetical protein